MNKYLKPDRFDVDPLSGYNCTGQWLHWKKTFENFLEESYHDAEETKKMSTEVKLKLLTNHVSPCVYERIAHVRTYEKAITILDEIFVKPKSEIFARHQLATRKQQPGETVDQYIQSLKLLSKECTFKKVSAEQNEKDFIRDFFISGLDSPAIRQRLLENMTLSLEDAHAQARAMESAQTQSESFNTQQSAATNQVKRKTPFNSGPPNNIQETCFFCGNARHLRRLCPAAKATCLKCEKEGHFAKVCTSLPLTASAAKRVTSPPAVWVTEEWEPEDGVKDEWEWDGEGEADLYPEHEEQQDHERIGLQQSSNRKDAITVAIKLVNEEVAAAELPREAPDGVESRGEQFKLEFNPMDKELHACSICHRTFVQESSLKSHTCVKSEEESCSKIMREKEKKKRICSCDTCGKWFTAKSHLIEHLQIHTGIKPYTCKICDKKFTLKGNLVRHKQIHNRGKGYTCQTCDKQFTDRSNLAHHKLIHKGEKPFKCKICNKKFTHRFRLARHKQSHKQEKYVTCQICDKQVIRYTLRRHQRVHTGDNLYLCEICMKIFKHKSSLLSHQQIHTGEILYYECEFCKKQFRQRSSLTIHRRIHTGEKPFKCPICEKNFSTKCALTSHQLIHTGVKAYECVICNKQFSRKANLVSHMHVHTEDKPYTCEICNKQYAQSSQLASHTKLQHTRKKPYQCEICKKQFLKKIHLGHHQVVHTGEKPYKCEICMKQFTRKCSLTIHLVLHTGEKRYSCEVCNKQFTRRDRFARHMLTHNS